MIDNLEELPIEGIASRAHELKDSGFRFVTMTASAALGEKEDGKIGDAAIDLFYSFDYKCKLVTLKATVPAGSTVPSLSSVYLAAAFVENEISELFGLSFSGLAIDYGGRFMLADGAPASPFGANLIIERKGGGGNGGK